MRRKFPSKSHHIFIRVNVFWANVFWENVIRRDEFGELFFFGKRIPPVVFVCVGSLR